MSDDAKRRDDQISAELRALLERMDRRDEEWRRRDEEHRMQAEEDRRQAAADRRQAAADRRQAAEYARQAAEYAKQAAEYGRQAAEYGQQAAEYGQQAADYAREAAEDRRVNSAHMETIQRNTTVIGATLVKVGELLEELLAENRKSSGVLEDIRTLLRRDPGRGPSAN